VGSTCETVLADTASDANSWRLSEVFDFGDLAEDRKARLLLMLDQQAQRLRYGGVQRWGSSPAWDDARGESGYGRGSSYGGGYGGGYGYGNYSGGASNGYSHGGGAGSSMPDSVAIAWNAGGCAAIADALKDEGYTQVSTTKRVLLNRKAFKKLYRMRGISDEGAMAHILDKLIRL